MINVIRVSCTLQDIEEALPVLIKMACMHESYMKAVARGNSISSEGQECLLRIGKAYWAGVAACQAVREALSDDREEEK